MGEKTSKMAMLKSKRGTKCGSRATYLKRKGRKAPAAKAACYTVGTKKKGQTGKMYKVATYRKASGARGKRWVQV